MNLPVDVWRIILRFNNILCIGKKMIDVSEIHNAIVKNRIHFNEEIIIVLHMNELAKWTMKRSIDGTILQTRSISCGGLCNPSSDNKYVINRRDHHGNIMLSFEYYMPLCKTCSCVTHHFSK